MNDPRPPRGEAAARGAAGEPVRHDSAHLHVSGEAAYTDDILEARGTLHAAFGLSRRAHARIRSMDLSAVRAAPGVVAVLTAADIPGENNVGPILHDDPILAADEAQFVGQPIFLVVAETVDAARRAARLAVVEYEDLPAILTIEDALAKQSFVLPSVTLQRGDWQAALAAAPHRLKGGFRIGGQEQFYLEGQVAYAVPEEDGDVLVYSSTQHPGEVQLQVAHALGVEAHRVVVECRRMGGGFGGKETQAAHPACAAALAARRDGQPVKLRYDRDDDITITGKRHDYLVEYDVGFDGDRADRGDRSHARVALRLLRRPERPVNDRAVMHADNAYFLPAVRHRVASLQDEHAVEHRLPRLRRPAGDDGDRVRHRRDRARARPRSGRRAHARTSTRAGRDVTPYDMQVEDFVADRLFAELATSSDYAARRAAIRAWNAASPMVKRGIAMTPVKFGISFTATFYNQAGALVHVYTDGSVLLNHGGTEMGQGLFTKVAQVVAHELGIDLDRVRVSAADTSKIPNASATAASSGSDLNGKAAQAAARGDQGATRRVRGRALPGARRGRPVRGEPRRGRRREATRLRRARAARVPRAHPALGERVLQDAEDPLRPEDAEGPAVLLLRLRRRGVGGRDRHADRRDAAAARRHPPRRRPQS